MRIAVYAKVLSEEQLTGIGFYAHNILNALARIDTENEYVLYSNQPLIHRVRAANFHERILRFPRFWSYLRLPFEFVNDRYDLLLVLKEHVPPVFRPKTVVVVYDLMGLTFPDHMSIAGKVHFWLAVHYAIPAADAVIAISEETKRCIIESSKVSAEKITVTHLGFDREVFKPSSDEARGREVRARLGLDSPYFINTSSVIWHRKNLVRVIEAFARLKANHAEERPKLVITGKPGKGHGEVMAQVSRLGLERDVILTGYLPLDEIPVLLSGAEALVFPSLDEGFGLPLVEAMACHCPVITSNVSAMQEVAGDAAILVDPLATEAIHAAMERVYRNEEVKETLRAKGAARAEQYSWDKAAQRTLEVLRRVGES